VIRPKKRSTRLIQDAEVGVKWKWKRGWRLSRQLARRPVRTPRRLLVKRHLNHALDCRRIQRLLAARPACIAPQTFDSSFNIAITPAIRRAFGLASRMNNFRDAGAVRPHQNNPSPPNQLLGRVATRHPAFQFRPILGRKLDTRFNRHAPDSHQRESRGILLLVPEH